MERLGRYDILNELGHGAMGTVYRAHDPKIDRVVALKTISVAGISGAAEEEFRKRFYREAQAAGKLSHPGIVTIHDVGEDDQSKTPFIVMEFIEGKTLEGFAQGERLPVPTALTLVQQVAEALDYAHSRKIVHRDIKPANIIVTPDGHAKITDFGVAKLQMSQFTQTGQILGTPAFMAPEQIAGGAVDGRSDLFSLGVILYWLLTGEKAFPGDTTTAITFKIVYIDPLPPTLLNPALTADHDYITERALAKDPARRYQGGRELADDIADLLASRAPRSRATTPPPVPAPAPAERTVVQTVVAAPAPPAARTVVEPKVPAPPEKTQVAPRTPAPQPAAATVKTEPRYPPPPLPPAVEPPQRRRRWLLVGGAAAMLLLLLGGAWWWWSSSHSTQEPGAAREAATGAGPSPPGDSPSRAASPRSSSGGSPPAQPRPAEPRTRRAATLRLKGEHNFEGATMYVYVDEALVDQVRLESKGARRRGARLGLGKIAGSVAVSAGRHTVAIRIKVPRDDFDQIQHIQGDFEPGQTRTLEISLGKLGNWVGIGELTRKLTLRWLD